MAENSVGLYFEIAADPSKAVEALARFSAASAQHTNAVRSHLSAFEQGTEKVRQAHEAAFANMTSSLEGYGNATLRVYTRVAEAIAGGIELKQQEVGHHARAEAGKLAISKRSVRELAVVKAAEAFAKGLEALGDFNFWSAGQYFASAALYGSLAAIQISGLIGGGGGGGPSRGPGQNTGSGTGAAGAGSAPALAAGAASAAARPSGNVTVVVLGEPQAAAWLTKTINQGVLQQDLILVSSHTKRSAPAGR